MPKFYNSDIAELAHQLTLSPRRLRVEQLHGVERLLGLVDADKAYPFEFVCFHVTGYRKRGSQQASDSIPGKALICDLVTFAEVLSRKSNVAVAEIGEECCNHIELAKQLSVSTKTVRRWRNRGLMGLRVVCEDGVNRLLFLRSTIDRFVKKNEALVSKGAAFSQLSRAERDRIVARARTLIAQKPLKLHAAAKIIADEMGRAVETVRYTLRRHDAAPGAATLFTNVGEPVRCERELAISRCHEAGDSAATIASAMKCSVDEIEQTLRTVKIRRWAQAAPEFVFNELFDAPNAESLILDGPEVSAEDAAPTRIPKDLPPYLRQLYLTPLLSREQEQDLFRRYNFVKYQLAGFLKSLDPATTTAEQVASIEALRACIEDLRQRITRANLRLVVSIAKKHVGWSANFFEVVSDGNVSLMRAVEKFDYSRGTKFSTYATWAVMKNYARTIPEQHYHAARYVTGQDLALEMAADTAGEAPFVSDRADVRELIEAGLQELEEREREIVRHHFGLTEKAQEPLTLEQLGKRFGVTKERVRQIEQRAISRLRTLLSPRLADAL